MPVPSRFTVCAVSAVILNSSSPFAPIVVLAVKYLSSAFALLKKIFPSSISTEPSKTVLSPATVRVSEPVFLKMPVPSRTVVKMPAVSVL